MALLLLCMVTLPEGAEYVSDVDGIDEGLVAGATMEGTLFKVPDVTKVTVSNQNNIEVFAESQYFILIDLTFSVDELEAHVQNNPDDMEAAMAAMQLQDDRSVAEIIVSTADGDIGPSVINDDTGDVDAVLAEFADLYL